MRLPVSPPGHSLLPRVYWIVSSAADLTSEQGSLMCTRFQNTVLTLLLLEESESRLARWVGYRRVALVVIRTFIFPLPAFTAATRVCEVGVKLNESRQDVLFPLTISS